MDLNLLVTAPPTSPVAALACDFAEQAAASGHRVAQVFFFQDAVATPGDQALAARWADLAAGQDADLLVCVGAATRRGVLDGDGSAAATAHPAFAVAGLGQLVAGSSGVDRVVTFA